jgi:hypothetical protein
MKATIRTLRNLNAGDQRSMIESWERDAKETMARGANESDKSRGKALLNNCRRWRSDLRLA